MAGNPEHLRKTLGTYIKQRRAALKLTQQKICDELAISCQFYGKIESGGVPCPDKALRKLVKILELSPANLEKIFVRSAKREARRFFRRE